MLPTVILPGYLESADVYLPLQQALTDLGRSEERRVGKEC